MAFPLTASKFLNALHMALFALSSIISNKSSIKVKDIISNMDIPRSYLARRDEAVEEADRNLPVTSALGVVPPSLFSSGGT